MFFHSLKQITSDEIIVYHHLGLGDIIICNGMVNYLSTVYNKVYLIVDEKYRSQSEYLYSQNIKVYILSNVPDSHNNLDLFALNSSTSLGVPILRVGWENRFRKYFKVPFYSAFYKQVKLPYSYSYKYFALPDISENELLLLENLFEYYKIDRTKKIILIHNEASDKIFNLKTENKNKIFVEKKSDPFNNLFLYRSIIKNVNEIHCINSSFIHFVDRLNSVPDLYYHHIRGSKLKLKNNWKIINYANKN